MAASSDVMGFANDSLVNLTDLDDPITSDYYKTVMKTADMIKKYYIWVICIVGFPANIASIITILGMKPVTSLTCYVALLAVVDILTLVIKLTHLIFQDFGGRAMTDEECKFLIFAGNVFLNYSSWILVAMAIERFVAVWFPFKLGMNWNIKKSFVSMAILLLILAGIYLHLLWTMTSYYGSCEISSDYHNYFIMNIWYWVSATLYAFLPCLLLFIFNTLIIVGIRKSANEHKSLTLSSSTSCHRDVTIMLLAVSIVFLILTTPIAICLLLGQSWLPLLYSDELADKYLFRQIAFVLCDSNHAINFFLYFLSARRFRCHFTEFFKCRPPSSPDTVLLRNRSYRYTTKFTYQGTHMYEDTDTSRHLSSH